MGDLGKLVFLLSVLTLLPPVYSANLGIPCNEAYPSGCDGDYCHCATICGNDYECGAEDGINPIIFFNGKVCPLDQQDPDSLNVGVYENIYQEGIIDILEGGTFMPCNIDGICSEGEGCDCMDCSLQEGPCIEGAVCDFKTGSCRCSEGTTYCESIKKCVDSTDQCLDFDESLDCIENCDERDIGEKPSCLCDNCNSRQDACTSIASCHEDFCENCELNTVEWGKLCIGNGHLVDAVVKGNIKCDKKEIILSIIEIDDSLIMDENAFTFEGDTVTHSWEGAWYDKGWFGGNPEYFLNVNLEETLEFNSPYLLEVQPCNTEFDSDCEGII